MYFSPALLMYFILALRQKEFGYVNSGLNIMTGIQKEGMFQLDNQ